MLEKYYALILKLIRVHYKKRVFRIALRGLLKFINRMPVAFVSQILNNLQSIYMLIESENLDEDKAQKGKSKKKKRKSKSQGLNQQNSDVMSEDKKRIFFRERWGNKLKLIRTMNSLWGKLNFEGQLESHYLQRKLYSCFLEWIHQKFFQSKDQVTLKKTHKSQKTENEKNQIEEEKNLKQENQNSKEIKTPQDKDFEEISEDLFVNFENLVVKPILSNSGTVSNWFILLFKLAAISERPKLTNTSLFLMNKMLERYPKLGFLLDSDNDNQSPENNSDNKKFHHDNLKMSPELTYSDNKSLCLFGFLKYFMSTLKRNNRGKYLAECLINRTGLGRKYIGIDLRKFLIKF